MTINTANLYKLSTKEDNLIIHKFLGIFCLIHFIYRYICLFIFGNLMFQKNYSTPMSLMFHGMLSLSSLLFKVPKNRHPKKPMIFQEFRWHSIIFGLRSVLCCLNFYYFNNLLLNILIINSTMIFADIVSYFYFTDTKTMRNMPFPEKIRLKSESQKNLIRMQSSQQVGATLFMMINIDTAFSPLFAIQLAAFLMTLVRKNIIGELEWHKWYSLSLWINVFLYLNVNPAKIIYIICSIFIFKYLRFYLNFNKYLIWNPILFAYFKINDIDLGIYNNIFRCLIIIIYLSNQIKIGKYLWIS